MSVTIQKQTFFSYNDQYYHLPIYWTFLLNHPVYWLGMILHTAVLRGRVHELVYTNYNSSPLELPAVGNTAGDIGCSTVVWMFLLRCICFSCSSNSRNFSLASLKRSRGDIGPFLLSWCLEEADGEGDLWRSSAARRLLKAWRSGGVPTVTDVV